MELSDAAVLAACFGDRISSPNTSNGSRKRRRGPPDIGGRGDGKRRQVGSQGRPIVLGASQSSTSDGGRPFILIDGDFRITKRQQDPHKKGKGKAKTRARASVHASIDLTGASPDNNAAKVEVIDLTTGSNGLSLRQIRARHARARRKARAEAVVGVGMGMGVVGDDAAFARALRKKIAGGDTGDDAAMAQALHDRFAAERAQASAGPKNVGTGDDAAMAQALHDRFATERAQAVAIDDAAVARGLQARLGAEDAAAAATNADLGDDAAMARALQARLAAEDAAVVEARRAAVEADRDNFLDVLADYRDAGVRKWLPQHAQGLGIRSIAANPHAAPGQPLYNRFVKRWEAVQDQAVQLAFHGTAEANIDPICREGLDPRRRSGQAMGPGEYFATASATSLPYCKGGSKMLVFALLMDKSGLTTGPQVRRGVVVVNKPEHQLPLFVITFDNGRGGPAAAAARGVRNIGGLLSGVGGMLTNMFAAIPGFGSTNAPTAMRPRPPALAPGPPRYLKYGHAGAYPRPPPQRRGRRRCPHFASGGCQFKTHHVGHPHLNGRR